MATPKPTHLDHNQILQSSYDADTQSLRTVSNVTAVVSGEQKIEISSTDDSVTIGDTSGNLVTTTLVNSSRGLDVNVIAGSSTVTGTVSVNNFPATQAISAASLPLPTGASTAANQVTANNSLSTISGQLPTSLGAKTIASSLAVNIASDQVVPVSGSFYQATQPISAASLPLPTGAATSANQVTANTSLSNISAQLPSSLGAKAIAASVAVNIASDQTVPVSGTLTTTSVGPTTGTSTSVASSASSVTLLASNASRKGATIYNDSTQILYLKLGTTASTSSYTLQVAGSGYYEVPFSYTGRIDGIWASANGNARVSELT